MTIEQHIEELRAELRNICDAEEQAEIAVEIERAKLELAAIEAHQYGSPKAGPPS